VLFTPDVGGKTMSPRRIYVHAIVALIGLAVLPLTAFAQGNGPRPSLMASVSQRLGTDTDITIVYSRPGVKGRVIWGDLVPYGMAPGNQYSDNKPFPWRAGANENTTIEFGHDLLIEGQRLPAGKYGIHMIPSQTTWTIIFSKKNAEWGSFSYDQAEDALRVTVTPVAAPHQEWLMFGFDDLAGTSATAYLWWEKLKVPFRIALAN
jgi:hypothetical protein